jgi:hypothetical protein
LDNSPRTSVMRSGKTRNTVEARRKYAMIGGTISQKKKRCQK